jgi:hypothetical protein
MKTDLNKKIRITSPLSSRFHGTGSGRGIINMEIKKAAIY